VFVAGILGLVACARGGSNAASSTPAIVTCAPVFEAPAGFEPLETFEESYPEHVGVRLGYRDEQRRELHAFAGIPGEFGEGLPGAGELALTRGGSGHLFGRGTVWVLVWHEGDACDPRAVLGNGLERDAFLGSLERSGIVTPE
jgi:hypothetical protein